MAAEELDIRDCLEEACTHVEAVSELFTEAETTSRWLRNLT